MTLKSAEFFSLFIEKWNLVWGKKKVFEDWNSLLLSFLLPAAEKSNTRDKKMNFCFGQTKRLADSMNGENIEAGFNTTTKTFQILTPITEIR